MSFPLKVWTYRTDRARWYFLCLDGPDGAWQASVKTGPHKYKSGTHARADDLLQADHDPDGTCTQKSTNLPGRKLSTMDAFLEHTGYSGVWQNAFAQLKRMYERSSRGSSRATSSGAAEWGIGDMFTASPSPVAEPAASSFWGSFMTPSITRAPAPAAAASGSGWGGEGTTGLPDLPAAPVAPPIPQKTFTMSFLLPTQMITTLNQGGKNFNGLLSSILQAVLPHRTGNASTMDSRGQAVVAQFKTVKIPSPAVMGASLQTYMQGGKLSIESAQAAPSPGTEEYTFKLSMPAVTVELERAANDAAAFVFLASLQRAVYMVATGMYTFPGHPLSLSLRHTTLDRGTSGISAQVLYAYMLSLMFSQDALKRAFLGPMIIR